jgi:hypothetical protein
VLTAPVVVFVVGLPRVQLAALNVPPPGGTLLLLQLTVPVGAVADTGVLSVTVAVQVVGLPTGTVSGAQLTAVLVACWRAVTTKVPELPRWVVSPP